LPVQSAAARQAAVQAASQIAPADSAVAPAPGDGGAQPDARPAGVPEQVQEPAPTFAPTQRITSSNERRCLEFLLEQGQRYAGNLGKPEIWASPFLRRLTDVLPELPDWERRQLISHLRDAGALRLEKREGEPHAFSVIIINYQHPDVQALNPSEEK
jgi:hypothetical protein